MMPRAMLFRFDMPFFHYAYADAFFLIFAFSLSPRLPDCYAFMPPRFSCPVFAMLFLSMLRYFSAAFVAFRREEQVHRLMPRFSDAAAMLLDKAFRHATHAIRCCRH